MPVIRYAQIPRFDTFRKDSSVTIGAREQDSLLKNIDKTLTTYNLPRSIDVAPAVQKLEETMLLAQLYFATDLWLKEASRGVGKPGRKPAIQALFERAVADLCTATGQPVNVLPAWIESTFGRGRNTHTVKLDIKDRCARYLTDLKADQQGLEWFRVTLNGGIARQPQWWAANKTPGIVESSRMTPTGKAFPWEGHSGYVLSIAGDFFAGPHSTQGGTGHQNSFFHSSYLGGDSVRCAGSWKVRNGVVEEITDGSGHYAPEHMAIGPTQQERIEDALIQAVEILQAYGVNIANLRVCLYANHKTPEGRRGESGTEFLARAERLSLKEARLAFLAQKALTQIEMEKLRLAAIRRAEELKVQAVATTAEMAIHYATGKHTPEKGKRENNPFECTLCKENRDKMEAAKQIARSKALAIA
jgi:hypothetical protein